MTDIDLQTGMPELPEGYFWRVSHEPFSLYYRVSIRKKFPLFGSRVIDWTAGFVSTMDEDDIREHAEYVLRRGPLSTSIRRDLLGNYPPKRLEQK